MSWTSGRILLPEEWWNEVEKNEEHRRWWLGLTRWLQCKRWTHVHTQTFAKKRNDQIRAGQVYCSFLVEHHSTLHLTDALWAVEQHPGGHGCHIHSLWNSSYATSLARLERLSPGAAERIAPLYRLTKRLSEKSLGFSRLWPIEEESCHTALKYALKYILKAYNPKQRDSLPPQPWEPVEKEATWGYWTNEAS